MTLAVKPRSAHVDGILLMTAGMLVIPGIDAIAKFLSDDVAAGQVAWGRFLVQSLILLPFVLLRKRAADAFRRPFVHFARGFLIAMATLMFFASLKYLPMADAIAIFFVEPFILTLISGNLSWRNNWLAAYWCHSRRLYRRADDHPAQLRNIRAASFAADWCRLLLRHLSGAYPVIGAGQ